MIKAGMVELGARYGQHRKKDTTPRLLINALVLYIQVCTAKMGTAAVHTTVTA